MESIISFINDFIETEHKLLIKFYDVRVSSENYQKEVEKFGEYFHEYMDNYESRHYSRDELFELEPEIFLAGKKKLLKRVFFKIHKYQDPKFGKQLDANISTNVIYKAYLSDIRKTTSPDLRFSKAFFIVKIDDSFKVFYEEYFSMGEWKKPFEDEIYLILDYGKLVGTQKMIEPEEERSLMDYNKE